MSRQDQYAISMWVDDASGAYHLTGIWDKMTGGEVDSEESKYKPGDMLPAVSLGGSVEVGNITVSRLYVLDRDHAGPLGIKWLLGRVGKGNVKIARQPKDVDGNAYGEAINYTGKLKTVTLPEVDSESGDAALLECEITPAGTVT